MVTQSRIKIALILIALVAAVSVLYFYNPVQVAWMPKCPVHVLTGLQCPACGGLRGTHSLLHLRFREALGYNPAFPLLMAIVIAMFVIYRRYGGHSLQMRIAIYTYIIVYMLWFVIRNLIGC